MKHDPSLHILRGLVQKRKPDYICLQETKLQEHHTDDVEEVLRSSLDCRSIIWSSSRGRKGYSGTALLIMHSAFPASAAAAVTFDLGVKEMDDEGRLICLRTKDFALINVYSPNSGASLARLGDRVSVWDVALRARMDGLATSGAAGLTGADKPPGPPFPVIVAGDLNVAHERIDFYQSGTACLKQAGLTPEERESFSSTILKADFIDSFRHTYPTERRYSYFSARQKPSSHSFKRGLRIDYVLSNVGPESISKERPPYIEDEVRKDEISRICPIKKIIHSRYKFTGFIEYYAFLFYLNRCGSRTVITVLSEPPT
jgi:exodeoxyribonuclease III